MQRREFLKHAFGAAVIALPGVTAARDSSATPIVLQESYIAGFGHHMGESVWPLLTLGDPLSLVREPDNAFDERAVAVYWNGLQLGYVPKTENIAVARMLEQGQPLHCDVAALQPDADPDARVRFCVCLGS